MYTYKSLLISLAIAGAATQTEAQIVGKVTDQKYGNTTVVYRDSTASDAEVLARLEAEMGMGDVIRITTPPPPVKPAKQVALPTTKASLNQAEKAAAAVTTKTPEPETPAFDALDEVKPAPALLASGDNVIAISVQAPMPVPQIAQKQSIRPAQTQAKTTAPKTVKSTAKAQGGKQIKTTGKLYKPSRSNNASRWFKKHRISLGKRTKYGCYKF